MSNTLTVAILAGGGSVRFGEDKALARLRGRPLLAYLLDAVQGLGAETLIVANRPEVYAQFGQRLVSDVLPGCGVLGGLYTALHYAASPWVLGLACDMPLVNRALLDYMATLAETGGVEAVLPQVNGRPEPLHALWSRACLAPIRAALDRGDRRVVSFLPAVRVRYVTEAEIDAYDPEHLSFWNVNTPAELEAVARRLPAELSQGDI